MTNYKSQYTGEQIDEAVGKALNLDTARILSAVEKVENAQNIYNYDGTVIIEKAESVLGLRRLKENYEAITTVEEGLNDEDLKSLISNYGVTIEPMHLDDIGNACAFVLFDMTDIGGVTPCVCFALEDGSIFPSAIDYESFVAIIPTFTVTATPNTTVDEWLLANTEGVSV